MRVFQKGGAVMPIGIIIFLLCLLGGLSLLIYFACRTPRCAEGHHKVMMRRVKSGEFGIERFECPICGRIEERCFASPFTLNNNSFKD